MSIQAAITPSSLLSCEWHGPWKPPHAYIYGRVRLLSLRWKSLSQSVPQETTTPEHLIKISHSVQFYVTLFTMQFSTTSGALALLLLPGSSFAAPSPATSLLSRQACDFNSASSPNCWGNFNINTNYYEDGPDTGVTREYWVCQEPWFSLLYASLNHGNAMTCLVGRGIGHLSISNRMQLVQHCQLHHGSRWSPTHGSECQWQCSWSHYHRRLG